MSTSISPFTSKPYGINRVCKAWDLSSSTYYRHQKSPVSRKKPGPIPKSSDQEVVQGIREDISTSPFRGEGHRKIHARLKRKGLPVGRNRVLKLMHREQLLSPHRSAPRPKRIHDKQITTDGPDQMWATDGTKIFTQKDGWVWLFTTVEHWNAECLGFHVTSRGNRFAALSPIGTALKKRFGSVERGVAYGLNLSLRTDHGCQYRSADFLNQLKSWGIQPSFGFVREPETNGVIERFYRTLKEQIAGEIFQDEEHVREVIGRFVDRYNESWLLKKLGYQSPLEARAQWEVSHAA